MNCRMLQLQLTAFSQPQDMPPDDPAASAARPAELTQPADPDDGQPSTVATRLSRRRSLASRSADAATTEGDASDRSLGGVPLSQVFMPCA